MDPLTFIAKIIEALAWPVGAVLLVAMLRAEIRGLLPYIKKLKAGPVEAEFERELKELKTTVAAQPQLIAAQEGITPERQMLLQLVQINARAAILEAWRGVEEASARVLQSRALYVPERESKSPVAVIRAISRESLLTNDQVALYHELRALRNQAAHTDEFAPTMDAALNYLELASGLKQSLEKLAK